MENSDKGILSIVINEITFLLHYKSISNNHEYENHNQDVIDCIKFKLQIAIDKFNDLKSLYSNDIKRLAFIDTDIDRLKKKLNSVKKNSKGEEYVEFSNERDLIHFSSTSGGITKQLYAYRSTSELGLWRLAYLDSPDRRGACLHYDKMTLETLDYVQSTIICSELQQFFTTNFNKIPFVEREKTNIKLSETEILFVANTPNIQIISVPYPTEVEANDIDNENRRVIMSPFQELKIGKCGDKIDHSDPDVIKKFQDFSDSLEDMYYIDEENIEKNIEKIYSTKVTSVVEGFHNCNITMYKIFLNHKKNEKNNVTLIFCKYKLEYSGTTYGSKRKKVNGYFGVTLLPQDSKINKYGIYTKFISADKYICKPVEYKVQCKNIKEPYICSKAYVYIGYLYNNIFPYNKLPDTVEYKLEPLYLGPEQNNKKLHQKNPDLLQVPYNEEPSLRTDSLLRVPYNEEPSLRTDSLLRVPYNEEPSLRTDSLLQAPYYEEPSLRTDSLLRGESYYEEEPSLRTDSLLQKNSFPNLNINLNRTQNAGNRKQLTKKNKTHKISKSKHKKNKNSKSKNKKSKNKNSKNKKGTQTKLYKK